MPPARVARAEMKESIVAKVQMGEWLVVRARMDMPALLVRVWAAERSASLETAQAFHGYKRKEQS